MSLREKDLERDGAETTAPMNFDTRRGQSSVPDQMSPLTVEGVTRSTSLAAPGQARDISHGPIPPGLTHDSSNNPILMAYRYHVGIHNHPSFQAGAGGPVTEDVQTSPASLRAAILSSLRNVISDPNKSRAPQHTARPASNVGIYSRVFANESHYQSRYKLFAFLINGALGLQIIFAAALTALGAGKGPSDAVTAFGALNTVLAGLLTFLKGSGLPGRFKYYENQYSRLREYIEQRERDLASDYSHVSYTWEEVAEEIAKIETMYDAVCKDVEANTPDSYNSALRRLGNEAAANDTSLANSALSRLNARRITMMDQADPRHAVKDLDGRVRGGVASLERHASQRWDEVEKQATAYVGETLDQVVDRGSRHAQQTQQRFQDSQQHAVDKAQEMENKIAMVAERAAEKVLEFTKHRHAASPPPDERKG